ncbi:MAG TPA: uroporphyrinogen-III C-methyltransferase [Methylophilaceae bacterium]|nr:uroporphyrinogen-III C-methyltransferase [Methylophilaceae bacterium]
MTENDTPDTDKEPGLATTAEEPAEPSRRSAKILGFLILVIVLLLVVLGILLWQSLITRHRINGLEQVLTQRLEQYSSINQQSMALARRAEERSAEAVAQNELLEQKLADSRDEQESLQALYKELNTNREERTVSEIEQLLIIANQQLQLAGNVRPALLALQTAYTRLQQIETPQASLLRKAVLNDIQHLQNLPQVNVTELNLQLEAIAQAVDRLPLVSDRHPQSPPAQPATKDDNPWRKLAHEVWQDFKSMVRLERIDRPEPPLLSPDQTFFLRENIKLRLLMARIALLQHDETSYQTSMRAAEQWVKQYFDTSDPATRKVMAEIRRLADDVVDTPIPDINESLGLVSKYKLSLEKEASERHATPSGGQE